MTKKKEIPLTGVGTHRAIARGYAGGEVIDIGDTVPAEVPVSAVWMAKAAAVAEPAAEVPAQA